MEPHITQKRSRSEDSSKKTLQLLTDALNKLPKSRDKSSQSPKPSSSKIPRGSPTRMKSSKSGQSPKPSSSKISNGTPTRKRGFKCDDNQPKITTWAKKQDHTAKEQKRNLESKLPTLDVTKSSQREKKPKTMKRSPSFDKYGIVLPSFEKIVADQKMFEEHKKAVQQFDALDEDFPDATVSFDCLQEVQPFSEELLDCKHLSLEDLNQGFRKHLKALRAIKSGEKYSQRHDRFQKNSSHAVPGNDLRCSTSMVVFTHEQNEHLLDLLRVELDPEEKCTGYFFKVLLPELCLRIFKDEHKMRKREARDYLDRRPLDI